MGGQCPAEPVKQSKWALHGVLLLAGRGGLVLRAWGGYAASDYSCFLKKT